MHIKSFETRWARADIVLCLMPPKLTCLYHLFKRRFVKGPEIDDRAPECPETVTWKLIKYMWNFENRTNPIIQSLQEQYPNTPFHMIRTFREKNHLLNNVLGIA